MENEQKPTPTPEQPAVKPITLQSILECKEGTSNAMGKILTGSSTPEQLVRMDEYQTLCLKQFKVLAEKLKLEVESDSNIKLAEALESTENRIIIEQKMIRFLIKTETPKDGIHLGEEMLGFVFAGKLVAPKENNAWGAYKVSLEEEKSAPPKGNTDFLGWGLLIIMAFVLGRALLKKYGPKGTTDSESNEKGPL